MGMTGIVANHPFFVRAMAHTFNHGFKKTSRLALSMAPRAGLPSGEQKHPACDAVV
jgi:hypothetical protein